MARYAKYYTESVQYRNIANYQKTVSFDSEVQISSAGNLTAAGKSHFNGSVYFNSNVKITGIINMSHTSDFYANPANKTGAMKFLVLTAINGTKMYFWPAGGVLRYSNATPTASDNGTAIGS